MFTLLVPSEGTEHAPPTVIDAPLEIGCETVALLFERARRLDSLGMTDAAKSAYLAVLARDDGHAGALNEFGRLLDRNGFCTAARSAFARAVALHPDDPTGHGNLANRLLDDGDSDTARHHYEIALRLDPENIAAHQCLAILHLRLGDEERAQRYATIGFRDGACAWPYHGDGPPTPVLVIYSALGGNVSTAECIDDRSFARWTLVAEFSAAATPLPPHALVFNAIGDADRCCVGLRAAQAVLERTAAPIINLPTRVMRTGRRENARRLAGIAGLIVPTIVVRSRRQLTTGDASADLAADGLRFPLILRAPGFHAGQFCLLVEAARDLASAVARLPGDELLAIEYVDVRRPDKLVRKYRVMIVGDTLFALHLAISSDWKVHYFSADMAERPDHRTEEAAFLADMQGVLGSRAVAALRTVKDRLGLDYGGIDFALDRAGNVVVFEANATMIVPPPPPDERWSYRRAPVERIHAAVRTMLHERARASPTRRC